MTPFRRYQLLKGTKHCPVRKLSRLLLAVLLLLVGAAIALTVANPDALQRENVKLRAQVQEYQDVLNGKVQMVESYPGGEFRRVAHVEWEFY